MPLSDREQHLLEQMEQALYNEDPKFASHMRGVGGVVHRRRYVVAAIGFLAGLGVVLAGVTLSNMWVGAVGFVVMVAAVWQAVAPPKRNKKPALGTVNPDGSVAKAPPPTASPAARAARAKRHAREAATPSSGTFMQRLEQRWERRRNQY